MILRLASRPPSLPFASLGLTQLAAFSAGILDRDLSPDREGPGRGCPAHLAPTLVTTLVTGLEQRLIGLFAEHTRETERRLYGG